MLWTELHRRGCSGPIIDWLRSLYENMRYIVRSNGETSDDFESAVGVLIGDPSSPTLWNLYLADFDPPAHPDNPMLGTTRVNDLVHADDGVLLSLSPHGLQAHLTYLFTYAGRKQLLTNALKTYLIIFNVLPTRAFALYLGDKALTYVCEVTYVGIPLKSDTQNICTSLYDKIKTKSTRASWAITGMENVLKDLPPAVARLLYTARIDALPCAGADVVPDMDDGVKELEKIQISFLQRTLGLSGHSMHTPPFTELKLMPLRHWRATLALRYLRYAIEQPPGHLVHAALEEQMALFGTIHSCWLGDLAHALKRIPAVEPIQMPSPAMLRRPGTVDGLIDRIDKALRAQLLADVKESPRLYLMRDRLKPQKRGPPKKALMQFRHYLGLRDKDDRKAFVRLLASEHPLPSGKIATLPLAQQQDIQKGQSRKAAVSLLRYCRRVFGARSPHVRAPRYSA
ncbi:unnamed protein product [Peniophora sp. CBMAI 1063]|nr:unnamed protein product [Peniophora sp. CBMAI 1063]